MLRKWMCCVVIVVDSLGAVAAVPAGPAVAHGDAGHGAQQSVEQRCLEHHKFGAQPVDVAKTADGHIVLAQTKWNWHDAIGCYLTLDDDPLATLRNNAQSGPTAEPTPARLSTRSPSRSRFRSARSGPGPTSLLWHSPRTPT